MDSAVGEQIKKSLLGGEVKELVDPYLLFSFAGTEVSFKYNVPFLLTCRSLQYACEKSWDTSLVCSHSVHVTFPDLV